MKKGFKNTVIMILIIIVCAILGFFLLQLIMGKSLNTNSTEINELYQKLGLNDLKYCKGLTTYGDEGVNFDSLDNSERICLAAATIYTNKESTMMKLDREKKDNECKINDTIKFATDNEDDKMCTIERIEKDKIKETYYDIYGKNLDADESFNLDSTTLCFPDEDYYYCGLSETYTVTIGAMPETYRNIKNAVEKGDEIIIYDYFLKIIGEDCFTSYTGTTKNTSCSDTYKKDTDIDYNFLKKYGTVYKHTFKKNSDGLYYWVESTPN